MLRITFSTRAQNLKFQVTYQQPFSRWSLTFEHVCTFLTFLYLAFFIDVTDIIHSPQDDPLWSASVLRTNPEVVRDIHLDFLRAGAEVHITATFSVFNAWTNYYTT